MEVRLTNLQRNEEKRMQNKQQTNARLHQIESNVNAFFQGQRKKFDADISKLTESLKSHLTSPGTKEAICRFVLLYKSKDTLVTSRGCFGSFRITKEIQASYTYSICIFYL